MLVITRKQDDCIDVADFEHGGVFIKVIEIKGNRVTLAFDAPREVQIIRWELKIRERVEQWKKEFEAGGVSLIEIEKRLRSIKEVLFSQVADGFEEITGISYDAYRRLPAVQ